MNLRICATLASVLVAIPAFAQVTRAFMPNVVLPLRMGAPTSVVLLHPNNQSQSESEVAPVATGAQIEQLRAAVSSSVGAPGSSESVGSSWSVIISPGTLKSSAVGSVSIHAQLDRPQMVSSTFARFPAAGGVIKLWLKGLKSGAAYVFGCAITLQDGSPGGSPVSIMVNDQTTTMTVNDKTFDGTMAFIAPPNGKALIWFSPATTNVWYWDHCTLGTAS